MAASRKEDFRFIGLKAYAKSGPLADAPSLRCGHSRSVKKSGGREEVTRQKGVKEMMPPQLLKDIHEQTVRDAQQAARKRRVGQASDLTWELKRHAGRFRKRLKTLWNVG